MQQNKPIVNPVTAIQDPNGLQFHGPTLHFEDGTVLIHQIPPRTTEEGENLGYVFLFKAGSTEPNVVFWGITQAENLRLTAMLRSGIFPTSKADLSVPDGVLH